MHGNQREGLLFLAVTFLVAGGGAVIGISPWIVVPLALVLGLVTERAFRRRQDEPPADPTAKPHTKAAVEFASALVDGEFVRARSLLTQDLQETLTCAQLQDAFHGMYRGYAEGKPTGIHFEEGFAREDWRSKRPGEVGLVYVGIFGEDFVEAVTVTVAQVENDYRISDVEWGRP